MREEVILVVDDEPQLRRLATKVLRSLGYQTLEAEDAEQARKLIEESPRVDVLFTDVLMPGAVDGRVLAHWAKFTHPDLKVLMTTGGHDVSPSEGVNVLRKPYRREELVRELRTLLQGRPR